MSIATDFQDLIDTLETNLQSMGVREAVYDPTTGIMALVNMITDIEPSTNIHLSLDLDLEANANSITYGENILLSATLLASYDDTSSSNVDLQTGEITGATITFKKGNTTIGTGITDENGVATLQYTPGINDCDTTLGFSAVFEGTSHFESANSTSVNVTVNSHLELTSNKNILSYADSDSAILTATLSSSQPTGRTINIYNDDTDILLGSMTDNNDGTYTYTYHSAGVGDLTLRAEVSGSLLTKTFVVEDCLDCYTTSTDFPRYAWGSNWYYLSPNEVPSECKVHMKFDNIVDNYQLGLGSSSRNFFAIQPYNNKTRVYRSGGVTDENVNLPSTSTDICFEILSSTSGKLYFDDTLIGTYTLDSSVNRYLKIVDYANKAYDLTYIKIKPL